MRSRLWSNAWFGTSITDAVPLSMSAPNSSDAGPPSCRPRCSWSCAEGLSFRIEIDITEWRRISASAANSWAESTGIFPCGSIRQFQMDCTVVVLDTPRYRVGFHTHRRHVVAPFNFFTAADTGTPYFLVGDTHHAPRAIDPNTFCPPDHVRTKGQAHPAQSARRRAPHPTTRSPTVLIPITVPLCIGWIGARRPQFHDSSLRTHVTLFRPMEVDWLLLENVSWHRKVGINIPD